MPEPEWYLRSALIPLIQRRTGHYGLYHPGSGAVLATDRLGVLAARQLLDGASLTEVHDHLSQTGSLSRQGFDAFSAALRHVGALQARQPTGARRWLRAIGCRWLGVLGIAGAALLPALPAMTLRWLLNWAPHRVLGPRIMAQARWYLDGVLSRSGYAVLLAPDRLALSRTVSEASSRTMLMGLLAALATPDQVATFIRRLVEPHGLEGVRAAAASGGVVVACLHSDGYLALLALHASSFARAACVVRTEMVSAGLEANAPPPAHLERTLGDQVSNAEPMAAKRLLGYVRVGGIVTVPIDAAPVETPGSHVATLAGRPFRASRGAAWLAARSGRPLYLATTRWDGRRVVVDYSEPLYAPVGMTTRERVAVLTAQLYARADNWVRAHPGDWLGWTFLEHYVADSPAAHTGKERTPVNAEPSQGGITPASSVRARAC